MKSIFLGIVSLLYFTNVFAQTDTVSGYVLKSVVNLPASPVKNQYRSGTCWSFSGCSFLESEVLRTQKKEVDLAEMWLVKKDYHERAIDYVRYHGTISFGSGAESSDVMDMISKYGICPESVFPGLNYGTKKHVHNEMDNVLLEYIKAVIKDANKKLTTAWLPAFDNILSAYLGEDVKSFKLDGKEYTPKSYQKSLGINPDDYVEFTSFTHHPFYEKFIMEVPDNWSHGTIYNIPLDEFYEQAIYALDHGYTLLWGADVSEDGFSYRHGIAIVPQTDVEELVGNERQKWEALTKDEIMNRMYSFENPVPEKEITQKMRQEAFDNYLTQDDHGMHITGYSKDSAGNVFFKVKNTWGTNNLLHGYFYASASYFKYKTIGFMIHKEAVMPKLQKKIHF